MTLPKKARPPRRWGRTCGLLTLGGVALGGLGLVVGGPVLYDGATCNCGPSERSAFRTLQSLPTRQALFRENDAEGDGELDYGTAAELELEAKHAGYRFEVLEAGRFTWSARATPLEQRTLANLWLRGPRRSFFIDQEGVVRARLATEGDAIADDPFVTLEELP